MFSTMLITPDNQRIIIPNSSIISGTIVNSSAFATRRIDLLIAIGFNDSIGAARDVRPGCVALRGQQLDPIAVESRVKSMLAANPEANVLHFTLGNQYAQQGRWAEAQQAYFKAFAANPENPDFAFNLAVSLDQLRQGKLALEYYRKALSLAETRGAAFDPGALQKLVRSTEFEAQNSVVVDGKSLSTFALAFRDLSQLRLRCCGPEQGGQKKGQKKDAVLANHSTLSPCAPSCTQRPWLVQGVFSRNGKS